MLDVITHLVEVLIDARSGKNVSTALVADAAGVSERTVQRWEDASSVPWKKDLPRAVAAYSRVTRIPERDLWVEAVNRAARADAKSRMDAAQVEAAKTPEPRRHQ